MQELTKRSFTENLSDRRNDGSLVAEQIESVRHPLVKQILFSVLSEDENDASLGSGFGEGAPPP